MSKCKWKNIKKIGLGIIAFEGTEHLANIITELRDIIDYVSIGLQRKSYHGDDIHPTDLVAIFKKIEFTTQYVVNSVRILKILKRRRGDLNPRAA